ncbi:MAG: M23 family metallopeptidase, partial [Vicinamibacteria bacterium]
ELLRVERVDASFERGGESLWEQSFERPYMERTEWIEGAFDDTTEYFMKNIEFRDNHMTSIENPAGPELPPGRAVSWVRIPFGAPWFAEIDRIELTFSLSTQGGRKGVARHSVPVVHRRHQARFRLPFSDNWAAHAGNDLATGHRRTGLNSLTMYGWDFTRMGPNGLPYRTDGSTPADYWGYDEPVLAAADGVVVHMRNDIPDYGVGETPPREVLEKDGDVFSGNLVTLDHGNGEFTLTCHMRAGTVPVSIGEEVVAGQLLGRVGNSGVSMYPHVHFNLMDGGSWLEAKGVPALFSDFEKIRNAGAPLPIPLGNPLTGWLVRPLPPR